MTKVQSFPFEKLPQYQSSQVELLNRVASFYPLLTLEKAFYQTIFKSLEEFFICSINLKIAALEAKPLNQFLVNLPEKSLGVVLHCEPLSAKTYIFFDDLWTQILVHLTLSKDKKIDQKKFESMPLADFTELQEAVIQFAVLEIIEKLAPFLAEQNFLARFDKMLSEKNAKEKAFASPEVFLHLNLEMRCWDKPFYLKIFLPFSFFDSLPFLQQQKNSQLGQQLKVFEDLPINLDLCVGDVEIRMQDLSHIEKGDIILFDQTQAFIENKSLKGSGQLYLGGIRSDCGYLAELENYQNRFRVKILDSL